MRVSMGWSQDGATPGTFVFWRSSATSFSRVRPGRHSCRGFSTRMVSIMPTGAGIERRLRAAGLADDPHDLGHLQHAAVLRDHDVEASG